METHRQFHRISRGSIRQSNQAGISVLVFLLILVLFSIAIIMVARVAPMYLEYYNVKTSLESLKNETKAELKTEQQVRLALRRRFNVNDIKSVKPENVRVDVNNKLMLVTLQYEVRTPLFANLSIIAEFSAKSEIPL
jgi:hypothetical protein